MNRLGGVSKIVKKTVSGVDPQTEFSYKVVHFEASKVVPKGEKIISFYQVKVSKGAINTF